jgi:1-acyl-sn-glycerol-3-phosphate acyltransferase
MVGILTENFPMQPAPPPDVFLPADRSGWPRRVITAYIRREVRHHFYRVHTQGLAAFRDALQSDPSALVLVANHSSWWDLYLAHLTAEAVPLEGYGMMEHKNVARFGFFRRIGAFSVDRDNPASVRASIAYTLNLLQTHGNAVWIFPQGRILCNDLRPLGFQPGLRLLAQRAGRLRLAPVAFRYEYWQEQRPEAFVRFGTPLWLDHPPRETVVAHIESLLTSELDSLRTDVLTQDAGRFQILFEGKRSIHETAERWRARFPLISRRQP